MKIRSLLPVQEVEQIAAEKDPNGAQSGKYDGKWKADLPHELKRLVRIIPHIPVHNLIHKYSCNKLTGSHENHAPYYLFPQRRAPPGPYSLLGEEHQADASQQEHGPVGEASKDHLERIIERTAQSSQK